MAKRKEGEKERAEMAVAAVTERARHGQYKLVLFEQDYERERGEREIVNWRLDERTDLASLWCQSSQWRISLLFN